MSTLSFIILTWNSERYLRRCFDSIIGRCEAEEIAYEVIIINNGSTDGSDAVCNRYLALKPGNFKIITLGKNRGTTRTRNLGLRLANGEYLCILDSDTELLEGGLADILRLLDQDGEIGIVAPKLLLQDGTVQNSVKRFPTFYQKVLKVPNILFRSHVPDLDFYRDFPFFEEREVDSAISACWLFRRELLDVVGLLDERIFYAPEDLDYCLRVRKAGRKILYYPSFAVLHHTQVITHKRPLSSISLRHLMGLVYYFNKHGGWFQKPRL